MTLSKKLAHQEKKSASLNRRNCCSRNVQLSLTRWRKVCFEIIIIYCHDTIKTFSLIYSMESNKNDEYLTVENSKLFAKCNFL